MGLAASRLELEKYDDALNAYMVAATLLGTDDAEPIYWIGICNLRNGDRKAAKEAFRKC